MTPAGELRHEKKSSAVESIILNGFIPRRPKCGLVLCLMDNIVSKNCFFILKWTLLYPVGLSMKISLLDDTDVSQAFAAYLRDLREQAKLSREALAQRSCVPAPTIKKFELTGKISFRQLLLLWQSLDSLDRLYQLTQVRTERSALPTSIEEVLKDEF